MISKHELYNALGLDADERRIAYRELFRYQLEPGKVDEIRSATNGNYALGSSLFQEQIAAELGRRVTRGKAGRPRVSEVPESLDMFAN